MTRDEVLQVLSGQVGPMGPFDSPEERDARWDTWLAGLTDEALPVLLSIVREPPADVRAGEWKEMEGKVSEALGQLGQRDTAAFVERVAPVLPEARPRPVLIDALGEAKAREALPALSALLDRIRLTEDELVRLAGALSSIGGVGAARLLDRMEPLAKDQPEALAEIGVAREILAFDKADLEMMAHHLVNALKALPKREQNAFLEHARQLLEVEALRKPLLELLGAVHSIPALSWLIDNGQLRPGELALCARLLGESGGPEARRSLLKLLSLVARSRETLAAAEQSLVGLREQPESSRLEAALGRSAEALKRMDRSAYRREVAPLLAEPRCRRAWATMLDGVQSAEGLAWLAQPLAQAGAEDADWIQWLRALGTVGGVEAKAALQEFRSSGWPTSAPVRRELEEAWRSVEAEPAGGVGSAP